MVMQMLHVCGTSSCCLQQCTSLFSGQWLVPINLALDAAAANEMNSGD